MDEVPDGGTDVVTALGEREAVQRLELLTSVSGILDTALDDYEPAVAGMAAACVPDFADLCVVEVIGPDGRIRTAAHRTAPGSALEPSGEWVAVGRLVAPGREAVLTFAGGEETGKVRAVRERLGAQSLIVAPITAGGTILGWFVAATGPQRRGFRESARRVGVELSSRLGTTIQRVLLHRQMQASAREQGRALRRLRRLATAATNLAGAGSPEAVLQVACVEACLIQEADGAAARWWMDDGSVVSAQTGQVDDERAGEAFAAVAAPSATRGPGWVAHPLPSSDPWQQAVLVVFVGTDLSEDEELVLSSLASLVPVAFERALGTEAAVRHEARLRAVVEASPVALIGVNPDGTVTLANRAALDRLDWIPDPAQWILREPMRSEMLQLADAVRVTGTVVNRTASVGGTASAAGFDLSLSGALLPATSPSDEGTVLIAGVDLTEVRGAERALVQAQRLEAMGVVAGRVAHDFNNLLTLIIGYSELLARGLEDPQLRAFVDDIEGAARRAATLTEQMLGMTRRGDTAVVADLGVEIANLGAVLARLAGARVSLTVRGSDQAVKVRMDPTEIEQIVINLVVNACDAMGGEGRVEVAVEPRVADPTDPSRAGAVLTVSDNGPGMPAEVLDRCIEPFFTTKPRGQGSGLGLSTVFGLVNERGGHLKIASTPGVGTSVRIWLPLSDEASTEADAGAGSGAEPAGADLGHGSSGAGASGAGGAGEAVWPADRTLAGRILFVEDDPELRPMGADALASTGLDVVVADSAEKALAILDADAAFDALVTDIVLPGLTGVQLVAAVRNEHGGLPVLYMTGYSGPPDSTRTPAPGEAVLRKPYRPDALRWRVAELLRAESGLDPTPS